MSYPNYLHYKTTIEKYFSTSDSVFFSISKKDYHAYINTDVELSFSQKHHRHYVIQVITIRSLFTFYLTLSQHNQLNIKESKYAILFVLFVILIGLYIFQFIWKKKLYHYVNLKGYKIMKTFLEKINKKF